MINIILVSLPVRFPFRLRYYSKLCRSGLELRHVARCGFDCRAERMQRTLRRGYDSIQMDIQDLISVSPLVYLEITSYGDMPLEYLGIHVREFSEPVDRWLSWIILESINLASVAGKYNNGVI